MLGAEQDSAVWQDAPLLYAALAAELKRRSAQRRPRRPALFADAELWVDPGAWTTALAQARETSRQLHELAKRPRTAGTVHVSASLVLFELSDES